MPYTKEHIEDKLRKALAASYVVHLALLTFPLIRVLTWRGRGSLKPGTDSDKQYSDS